MKKITTILAVFLFAILSTAASCPKPQTPPGPPTPVFIDVEVCPASVLLPNDHCPSTEIQKFEKGKEPTTACLIHFKPTQPFLAGQTFTI